MQMYLQQGTFPRTVLQDCSVRSVCHVVSGACCESATEDEERGLSGRAEPLQLVVSLDAAHSGELLSIELRGLERSRTLARSDFHASYRVDLLTRLLCALALRHSACDDGESVQVTGKDLPGASVTEVWRVVGRQQGDRVRALFDVKTKQGTDRWKKRIPAEDIEFLSETPWTLLLEKQRRAIVLRISVMAYPPVLVQSVQDGIPETLSSDALQAILFNRTEHEAKPDSLPATYPSGREAYHAMEAYVRSVAKTGNAIQTATLVQYASVTAAPIIEALLLQGTSVDLYVVDPDTADPEQHDRIRSFIDHQAGQFEDTAEATGRFRLYVYPARMASLRVVRFSDHLICVGWFRNKPSRATTEVWAHTDPMCLIPKTSQDYLAFDG